MKHEFLLTFRDIYSGYLHTETRTIENTVNFSKKDFFFYAWEEAKTYGIERNEQCGYILLGMCMIL